MAMLFYGSQGVVDWDMDGYTYFLFWGLGSRHDCGRLGHSDYSFFLLVCCLYRSSVSYLLHAIRVEPLSGLLYHSIGDAHTDITAFIFGIQLL